MTHPMRRADRQLPKEEAIRLLEECEYGILSTYGADGYPYGVPVSYAYEDGVIYIHGAFEGHKIENISHCEKVSFTVVGRTHALADVFSTNYESAIAFGTVRISADDAEKVKGLKLLVDKYAEENRENGYRYAEKAVGNTNILCVDVEEVTGKSRTVNGEI